MTGAGLHLLFTFVLFSAVSCKEIEKREQLVVVKVSGHVLRAKEFANTLAFKLRDYDALSAKEPQILFRIKEKIVSDFIIRAITEDWAQANNVSVSDQEVLDQIQAIRGQYPDDISFRRNLASEHLSLEQWKADIRHSLLQKKVLSVLRDTDNTSANEEKLKDYYESHKQHFNHGQQIRVQQIVVKRRENAEQLLKEIQKNSDFGELAKKYSIAPEAVDSGVTGWIDINTLEVFQKAYSLPLGRAKMLKSPFGYHILKVIEKRDEGSAEFEEVKKKISAMLREEKEQNTYTAWLDRQVRQHKIFKNQELIAKIFVETGEN